MQSPKSKIESLGKSVLLENLAGRKAEACCFCSGGGEASASAVVDYFAVVRPFRLIGSQLGCCSVRVARVVLSC